MILPLDDVGSGRAVLLLHAGIADRRMWSGHLSPLADAGFRVLAMDLPGFGEAPVATVEQAPWKDVLETLRELKVERAAVVGNSFGGFVALAAAVCEPKMFDGLLIVSSPAPGLEPSAELASAWAAEEAALERSDIDAAVDAVLDAWLLADAPAELRNEVAAMQRCAFEGQVGQPDAPEARDPVDDDLKALAAITSPALIAVGEHDMRDFHTAAGAIASALPNARRTVVAGAGHLAPLERPEAFREMVLAFLRSTSPAH
jgi:pimeloyl-ACP methyl ester carboxylesterase